MKDFKSVNEMLQVMETLGFTPSVQTYTSMMIYASVNRHYEYAQKLFDEMLRKNLTPSSDSWTALIRAVAESKGSAEGIRVLNRLENMGVQLNIAMFNCVLKVLVNENVPEAVNNFWLRMHSVPNVSLSLISFKIYLRYLGLTGNVERAFLIIDEMTALNILPTIPIFQSLFRICAEAPHWLHGYENIIFDAMSRMEREELIPTTDIYNAIIYAFGRACDPNAAEFYFWEMRQKGLEQNTATYNSLLLAYARGQTIGAKTYGSKVPKIS
jgi:pentatricopeptide repeat protein